MSTSSVAGKGRKRKRLTFACNVCRSRKIKCDDHHPTCMNCLKAGVECVTTDPRQNVTNAHRREVYYRDYQSPEDSIGSNNEAAAAKQDQGQSSNPHHQKSPRTPLSQSRNSHTVLDEESTLPTPAAVANAPLPVLPRFVTGNSLQVLTQWLDLAFARIGLPQRFSMRYNIDPLSTNLSKASPLLKASPSYLPLGFTIEPLAESFSSSVNLLYPLFDIPVVKDILVEYSGMSSRGGDRLEMSSSSAIALLMVACVRSQNSSYEISETMEYLQAAYSLLSIIIAEASLRSCQALVLMVLVLRNYNEIEMAWHLLHTSVSIAQSLGIHRRIPAQRRTRLGEDLSEEYVRTWWALYSLEKLVSLEIERHSAIRDSECDQSMPHLKQSPPIFESIIKLAQVQSQVNERCILARSSEEDERLDYQDIIREKLVNAGELDEMLISWEEALATDLRPSNHLYCNPKILPHVAFMAMQYHQTLAQISESSQDATADTFASLVLLHRNTLLVNLQTALKEIEIFCSNKPYFHRLKKGKTICGNAARSIISVLENVYEHEAYSVLNSITAPLIAVYAIAVHTLKFPTSGLAKADLELQVRAIQLVKKQQHQLQQLHQNQMSQINSHDYDTRIEALLDALQSQVTATVNGAPLITGEPTYIPTPASTLRTKTTTQPAKTSDSAQLQRNLQAPNQSLPSSSRDLQPFAIECGDSTILGTHHHVASSGEPLGYTPASIYLPYDETMMAFEETDWNTLAMAFDLPWQS